MADTAKASTITDHPFEPRLRQLMNGYGNVLPPNASASGRVPNAG